MIPAWIVRWGERRVTPRPGPVSLTGDGIYLLPNRSGLLVGVALGVMLLLCLNYNLNLGFLVTFLAISLFFVSIFHTYRTLRGLQVGCGGAEAVFAGEPARFSVTLTALTRHEHREIRLERRGAPAVTCPVLPPGGGETLGLEVPTLRRGWQPLGALTVSTQAPLGVMVAWSPLELQTGVLVYPAPEVGGVPLPPGEGEEKHAVRNADGDEEYYGVRPYHAGDPPRSIHWKATARTGMVHSRQFQAPRGERLTLTWEATAGLEEEARLSRLCRWVLEAEAAGLAYALHLPGVSLPHGSGSRHRERCLTALARHGAEPRARRSG